MDDHKESDVNGAPSNHPAPAPALLQEKLDRWHAHEQARPERRNAELSLQQDEAELRGVWQDSFEQLVEELTAGVPLTLGAADRGIEEGDRHNVQLPGLLQPAPMAAGPRQAAAQARPDPARLAQVPAATDPVVTIAARTDAGTALLTPTVAALPAARNWYEFIDVAIQRMRPSPEEMVSPDWMSRLCDFLTDGTPSGEPFQLNVPHVVDAMRFRYDPEWNDEDGELELLPGDKLDARPCQWRPLSQQDCVRILELLVPDWLTIDGPEMADLLLACWRNAMPDEYQNHTDAPNGEFSLSSGLRRFVSLHLSDVMNFRPSLPQVIIPPSARDNPPMHLYGGVESNARIHANTVVAFLQRIHASPEAAALWPAVLELLDDETFMRRLDWSVPQEALRLCAQLPFAADILAWADRLRNPVARMLRHVLSPRIMVQTSVNSSGDVYHLLAYIAWCQHMRLQPCRMVLCYDVPGTRDHAQRAIQFAQLLGMGDFMEHATPALLIPGRRPCYRPSTRQLRTEALVHQAFPDVFVDHRLSTAVVSDAVLRCGRDAVCEVMRQAFSRNAAQHEPVREWVEARMSEVRQQVATLPPDQPTVLLHYRTAAGANDHQDLDDIAGQLVQSMVSGRARADDPVTAANPLPPSQRRYGVIVLYAGAHQAVPGALMHLRPFDNLSPPPINPKLAHLYLLLALYNERAALRLRGVVGNTSGTLDLAALLGHCVLDIHNFQSGTDNVARVFNYQSYRLLMQFPWIAVVDRSALQMRQQILQWLALQTDMRRLSVNDQLEATDDIRVLRSEQTAAFSAVGGLGEKGFRMVVTEYINAANGGAGWRALPPEAVGEIVRATHNTMRQQNLINAVDIQRLNGLTLSGPAAQDLPPLVPLQHHHHQQQQ